MDNVEEIIHKNYLLTRLVCAMQYPRPEVVCIMRNASNELVVMFQHKSSVKATMGPAKWLDAKGVAHTWKIEGHPEFELLVDRCIYIIGGNVMCPEFAWCKKCMNPSRKYLKSIFPKYKLRAYLYDTIMEKFVHGISFKRVKSFTNNEHFEVVTKAEVDGMPYAYLYRNAKELEKQFKRIAA